MPLIALHLTILKPSAAPRTIRLLSLEDLKEEWRRSGGPDSLGLLDVGFAATKLLTEATSELLGRIYLTPNAAGVFQPIATIGDEDGLHASGMPMWRLHASWIDDSSPLSQPDCLVLPIQGDAWLADYARRFPEHYERLVEADIRSDAEYLTTESALPAELREHAGKHRFAQLLPREGNDPIAVLSVAPPWFLSRPFDDFETTVRVRNVLSQEGLDIMADLLRYKPKTLLGLRSFGAGSLLDLTRSIIDAVEAGTLENAPSHRVIAAPGKDSASAKESIAIVAMPIAMGFRRALKEAIAALPTRSRDVLLQRMAPNGGPRTLKQIAQARQVTGERIRQIETKAFSGLARGEIGRTLSNEIVAALTASERPIPLEALLEREWFIGAEDVLHMVPYLVKKIGTSNIHYVEFAPGEPKMLANVSQEEWDDLIRRARALLPDLVGTKKSDCRDRISTLSPRGALGIADLLIEKMLPYMVFGEGDDPTLLTTGRSVEAATIVVLASLERPMSVRDVQKLVQARHDGVVSTEATARALQAHAIGFGSGVFGTERHIGLDADGIRKVLDIAEHAVLSAPNRQWHTSELLKAVKFRIPDTPVNKHVLDHLLASSEAMVPAGRLLWRSRAGKRSTKMEVLPTMIQLLEEANGPLKQSELRARVRRKRGIDDDYPLPIQLPIIRLSHGTVGLLDRDSGIAPEQYPAIVEVVLRTLSKTQKSIHHSEWEGMLKSLGHDWVSGIAINAIASQDPRIKAGPDGTVYLAEWGNPRRMSLDASIKHVLQDAHQGKAFDQIMEEVERLTGRTQNRRLHLRLGVYARMEAKTRLWFPRDDR